NLPPAQPSPSPSPTVPPPLTPTETPAAPTYALRFYGTGYGDVDRLKIPLVSAEGFGLPVNVSLYGGQIAFGVHNGGWGYTIYSYTVLSAEAWHHVAVTRRGEWVGRRIHGTMRP
ncbi:MAG: hypothetical protein ACK4VW_10405, partial [Anaerolineales bacterium]